MIGTVRNVGYRFVADAGGPSLAAAAGSAGEVAPSA